MSVCYKSVKGGRVEGKMYEWVYGMCVYVSVCVCIEGREYVSVLRVYVVE
jgi:hypothetical protein